MKLHLAAIRNLFDWLVTGQVMKANPAASVRGPRYQIVQGKTPPLTAEEVRAFLATCNAETLAGQRDRALFAVMLYSFARVGAMLGTKVEDYYHRGKRGWLRLHEKGGRFHEVPLHHQAEEYLDSYMEAAGLIGAKSAFLFQAVDSSKMAVTGAAIGRRGVLARVKRVVKLLELHDGVCNHSFRATGITLFRKAGGTLEKARILAGHASTKTTQVYDHSGDEVSASEVERIVI